MKVFNNKNKFQLFCQSLQKKGSVGFVPTMGCLHEGHLSLIKNSLKTCKYTVVSIFVNPLQFGKNEDLNKYPHPLENDLKLCHELRCTAVFIPDNAHFYSPDFSIKIEETSLSKVFCGQFRPGHFSGVITVVTKLLNCTNPDILFLGQKDYQQCLIIKRLIHNLDFNVKVKICKTSREKSGLALSSRNQYLSTQDKSNASLIYQAMKTVALQYKQKKPAKKEAITNQNINLFNKKLNKHLNNIKEFKLQYADIVCADSLGKLQPSSKKAVILVAGFFKKTRLIDNLIFNL